MRYFFVRLLDTVPTLFLVLTLVFIAMRVLPGDPAIAFLGDLATPDQLAAFRERLGLDLPLWQQYLSFLADVATLDFGRSLISNAPVIDILAQNLPYTIELTLVAMVMGVAMGLPLGVFAAVNRGKLPDSFVRGYALVGYAVPDFYVGAVLLITLSLNLGLFPISGAAGDDADFLTRMHHVLLPALTLAVVKSAFLSRLTRTAMLDVLGKDYVRTARAKGAREHRVTYRHGLRNAMLPVSTGIGLSTLATLSGSVAVEMVFNRPGLGSMLINGISERDYPVVQSGIVIFALFVVIINLLMDLFYLLIDPRIRTT